jgi:hypothetical protein
MMEMWAKTDDGKILMKENWIKQFQFKIETMKLVKKMLDEV